MSADDNFDTPFDSLAEERAQRPTQPLPARLAPPRSRGGKLPVPTGDLNDYGDLPQDDDDSAPQSTPPTASNTFAPTGSLPRRIPTGTVIGLSVVAGALLVVVISLAMNALIPKPEVNRDGMVGDIAPQVTVIPPEDESELVEIVPPVDNEVSTSSTPKSRVAETEPDQSASRERSESGSSSLKPETTGGQRFTHDARGYQITPPADFELQQQGRRTIWKGPDNSQLLVETTSSPQGSPREGWNRLNQSLARKYGSRYRNLGIRETTLAGQPAAAWEFEITGTDGTVTRKIDVAVHHQGTGYAVLGAAPAGRFEELRPQLEKAINSLQLPARPERAVKPRNRRQPRRSTPERQPPPPSEPDLTEPNEEIEGY